MDWPNGMLSFRDTRKDWPTDTGRPCTGGVFRVASQLLINPSHLNRWHGSNVPLPPIGRSIHAAARPPCTCSPGTIRFLVMRSGLSHSTFPLRPVGGRLNYPSRVARADLGADSRPSRRLDYPTDGDFPTDFPTTLTIDCQRFLNRLGKSGKYNGVTRCLVTALTLSGR